MEIYDALKKDHDKIKDLLEQLVGSADAPDKTRKKLINQIHDELIPHARAEEAIFYNSLRDIEAAKDLVQHGYREHIEAETLLRALEVMDATNMDWTRTAQKLKDAIEHHIHEEETEIFTAARQLFIKEEAEMMTEAFQKMKPQVREGGFMQNTLDMVANLMPNRFSERLRNFTSRPE